MHGGNRACYVPGLDQVRMPPFPAFRDAVAYYAPLAHEATHWTGHARRCARDLRGRFGEEAYAAEELVAELGAAFLCADVNQRGRVSRLWSAPLAVDRSGDLN